jgi:hypothetical protein
MMHARIAERIAKVYLEVYRKMGFKDAATYAARMTKDNQELHEQVKRAVGELVRSDKHDTRR